MKTALLFCSLFLPLAATAQKLTASHPPVIYHVGKEKVFLYRSADDTTASKSSFFLYPEAEANVVGELSSRWVIVKREGFLYLAPSARLISPNALNGAPVLLDGTILPFDETTHQISYQGVVEVSGATKEQLYTRAYEWMARTYRSANAVIQMQDKEAGRLMGKGNSRAVIKGYSVGVVNHTLTIYLKDGRYKYVLTDLNHDASGAKDAYSGGPLERPEAQVVMFGGKKAWDGIRKEADSDAKLLIASLQSAMSPKGGKDPSDF
jgi:hypothetical protein